MSDLFERVARAIHALDHANEEQTSWDLMPEVIRGEYRADARAAIAAMLEPTDRMIKAGSEVEDWMDYPPTTVSETIAENIWRAMIKAEL